ncbi:MAG: cytochrome c [Deltaproteobacteria bacterium]|nr:cytochrome c [Deltaproteobacteria bacterium]
MALACLLALLLTGCARAQAEGPADEKEQDEAPKPVPSKTPVKKPVETPKANSVPTKRKPDREAGRDTYLKSCWQCHGETGTGDGPAAAAMVGGVPTLVPLLEKGVPGDQEMDRLVDLVLDGKGRMPAYREDYDKHQIRRVFLYLTDAVKGKTAAIEEKAEGPEEEGNEN